MNGDKKKEEYTLMPLQDFKAILCLDDRDDKISTFCLVSATHTIEQYCKRRLLKKKHFEHIEYTGDLLLPLAEYPVQEIIAVFLKIGNSGTGKILEPELYEIIPDCGTDIDLPFNISLSPALRRYRRLSAIKAVYIAGYEHGKVPPDLASACMELAAWNMNRYKGRRIGMTGNTQKDGLHIEMSMPENVKHLLEPYMRKTI